MTTEPKPIPPAALLRENETLMRQAAYYYMETEPEQKQLAADVLIRATLGQYDKDMVDAFVQRGPGRELDLYDGFFLGSFLDALNRWQLVAGSFDVPHPPARRRDIAENQRRLESFTMMERESFDVTTGVPARFTALYHGGHGGRSFGDGTLGWNSTITLTTNNLETGEIITHAVPPGQCILVAGTASIYDMRYLLKNFGAVARWPRGKARMTLIVKTDPDLWRPQFPSDMLDNLRDLGERLDDTDDAI